MLGEVAVSDHRSRGNHRRHRLRGAAGVVDLQRHGHRHPREHDAEPGDPRRALRPRRRRRPRRPVGVGRHPPGHRHGTGHRPHGRPLRPQARARSVSDHLRRLRTGRRSGADLSDPVARPLRSGSGFGRADQPGRRHHRRPLGRRGTHPAGRPQCRRAHGIAGPVSSARRRAVRHRRLAGRLSAVRHRAGDGGAHLASPTRVPAGRRRQVQRATRRRPARSSPAR